MLVLGDIGELREEAEGTNDLDGLRARQTVESRLEILPRGFLLISVESD
jgi:hypothetical protein